jgi:UDP-3-O-[3-hydroxymyristoyl] glucosamine N-acyltransferase
MRVTGDQIANAFPSLVEESYGALDYEFQGASSPEAATPSNLVFLSNARYTEATLHSNAGGVVVSTQLAASIREKWAPQKLLLISPNPELLKAHVLNKYWARHNTSILSDTPKIHSTAVIDPTAKLGRNVYIGPHVVIGAGAVLGDDCSIGANTVVEEYVSIGARSEILPLVYISHHCRIGQRCRIDSHSSIGSSGYGFAPDSQKKFHHIPQMGWVELEDDVEIGANCGIDRGSFSATLIRRGSKIDNLCHIAHNCVIGQDCMITAGFRVAGSTQIGDRFQCGGGCKMAGHITIANDVTLAGGSTVVGNITQPGEYGGHPLLPIKEYLKVTASIAHLTRFRKTLNRVMKHLNLSES